MATDPRPGHRLVVAIASFLQDLSGAFSLRENRDSLPGARLRAWSLRDWPQAATFQATLAGCPRGSFYHPRFARATKTPNRRIPRLGILVWRYAAKTGLKKYRYITHACGLTRSFTHAFLWMGTFYHPRPIRSITHAPVF